MWFGTSHQSYPGFLDTPGYPDYLENLGNPDNPDYLENLVYPVNQLAPGILGCLALLEFPEHL